MGNNGPSYKPKKLGFFSQAFGPLKHLQVQQIIKGKIIAILKVGDIWIPIDIGIKNYCS